MSGMMESFMSTINRQRILKMKALLHTLSRFWLNIQGNLFPWIEEELGPLTEIHYKVVTILEVVRIEQYVYSGSHEGPGRPPANRQSIARAFVAKAVMNLPTTVMLLDRLKINPQLRRICGWEKRGEIPDESTFSRAFAEFYENRLPEKVHAA